MSQDPRITELRDRILSCWPEETDTQDLARAADFAIAAHEGQTRASGDPFILHPLHVALILTQEKLSQETVMAGLLHDTVEDCKIGLDDIRQQFGDEVAHMVDGVTKIQRAAPRGSKQREQLDTYRKLVLASAEDLRTLLVKLADRLHNMRTLQALPAQRQERIALETLQVYAPLAHRLGMSRFKEEMEDRALEVLDPEGFQMAGMLQRDRAKNAQPILERMAERISEQLRKAGIEAEISTRVKSRYSIHNKVKRSSPEAVHDILGLRILVDETEQCYTALGVVHTLFPPRFDRFKDYIAVPRANLYQSIHTTVVGWQGKPVEIQIRTRTMHQTAEHGVAAHWLYKEQLSEGGPGHTRRFIRTLAAQDSSEDAYQALRQETFEQEIYAFTPKGDVRLFPEGATALDFAYSIHTDVGHRTVGVRINGEMRSLSTALTSGDVVEIITSDSGRPRPDWLEWAVTPRARQRIRAALALQEEPERLERGRLQLIAQLKAAGLGALAISSRLEETARQMGFEDLRSACLEASKEGRAKNLVERLMHHPPASSRRPAVSAPLSPTGLLVEGQRGVSTRLAGCCTPRPGQELVGLVTIGRGVSVHRRDCPQITKQHAKLADRLVEVVWEGEDQPFRAEMKVVFANQPQLLRDISNTVHECGAELEDVQLRLTRGVVKGRLAVRCTDPEAVMLSLAALPATLQAELAT